MLLAAAIAAVAIQADFDSAMRAFEAAKGRSDWASAEASLNVAHRFRRTDYSVHSLAWVYGRQNRFAEQLQLSHAVVQEFGPTPMALAGLAGAALDAAEMAQAGGAIAEAERRGYFQGQGWISDALRGQAERWREASSPAVYELEWTIPNRDFPNGGARKFFFPVAKHPRQTFTFRLEGAAKHAVEDDGNQTVVEIWPKKGADVVVRGTATLRPIIMPLSERLVQTKIARTVSDEAKIPHYYWSEKIDPALPANVELAKTLRRGSALETMQAILDWRSKNITYGQPPSGNTLETILASKKGVCHHSAYLTVMLAKANGLDAFVVGGYVLPPKGEFKNAEGSHGWGEVKLPRLGWVEYESQDANSLRWFVQAKHFLRYRAQKALAPERHGILSCQGYLVSGRRVR